MAVTAGMDAGGAIRGRPRDNDVARSSDVRDLLPECGLVWLELPGVWLGPFLVFAAVGALLASRQPRQPIGCLLVTAAVTSDSS